MNKISEDKFNVSKLTNNIISESQPVFEENIGTIPIVYGEYKLPDNAKPIYLKPRPIPFAIRKLVEEEVLRLEIEEIFEKVSQSESNQKHKLDFVQTLVFLMFIRLTYIFLCLKKVL